MWITLDDKGKVVNEEEEKMLEDKDNPTQRCNKFRYFMRQISLGKYETKLYHRGMDSQSSTFGGMVTILCAVSLAIYSYFLFSSVISREFYNLDRTIEETQRYEYKVWDEATQTFSLEPSKCIYADKCSNVTIKDIIVPLMNRTYFFVEYPEARFSEFNCNNLTA